jgi:hypothetical protein
MNPYVLSGSEPVLRPRTNHCQQGQISRKKHPITPQQVLKSMVLLEFSKELTEVNIYWEGKVPNTFIIGHSLQFDMSLIALQWEVYGGWVINLVGLLGPQNLVSHFAYL